METPDAAPSSPRSAENKPSRRKTAWLVLATCVALVLVGWAAWVHWEDGRWNSKAVSARFIDVTVQRQNEKDVHLLLHYDLANTTESNYRLAMPPLGVLMQRDREGELQEVDSVIWEPVVVRAGKTATVEFDLTLPATGDLTAPEDLHSEQALKTFADHELSQYRGLVFFDYGKRYWIDLPRGWS